MPAFTPRFALVAVTAAALAWLILSEPGAKFLASWIQPWRAHGPEVGRLMDASGTVKTVRDGQVNALRLPLQDPIKIYSGDRIELGQDSKGILVLNSRDELELRDVTAVQLQSWDERDPQSPIYVTVLAGDVTSKKAGDKGKAFVVRDGRLYLPNQKATGKPLALTVVKNAPLDMQLDETPAAPPPTDFDPEAAFTEDAPSPENFGAEPETLSNEYIDETIVAKASLLQKCWIARVKEDLNVKAKLTVQFQITRRGKVQDVRIVDASLDDENLKNCVTQVFERLTFRSFKGAEISLSYPLQFE